MQGLTTTSPVESTTAEKEHEQDNNQNSSHGGVGLRATRFSSNIGHNVVVIAEKAPDGSLTSSKAVLVGK